MNTRNALTEAEIVDIVTKFESCAFRLDEFTHARHITVACWYLATLPFEEALLRMRSGLQHFIGHHRKAGYHETITQFWMILLEQAFRSTSEDRRIPIRVQEAVAQFPDKDVLFRYYTREKVMSEEARERWIEPDLRPVGLVVPVR